MAQAVSSLPNGTYDVVVIAHACHANGVGGDFVESNNTLSVNGLSKTVATIDNSAVNNLPLTEYTFENVSVTDGTMNIKFSSDAAGANWYTIRVKSVTLKGSFTDKTNLLTNANFAAQTADNQNITGWTTTGFVSHTNNPDFNGTFAEMYSGGALDEGSLSQEIELPKGIYVLSANIRSRRVTSYLYASIGGNEQKHAHIGDDGVGVRALTFVVRENGTVTVGFKHSGAANGGDDKWVAVDDITLTRIGDVGETSLTSQIANPSFETGDFTKWTNTGSMAIQGNTSFEKTGTKYAEYWQPNGTKGVSQTLSGLPSGSYRLLAHAKARGVTSAKVFAGSSETAVTIADSETDYNVPFISKGEDVTIGFEGVGTGAGSSWLALDNFRLQYYGPCVASEAIELPDGGAMAANTWYYFDIAFAGNDYKATATELNHIICVTDGYTLTSENTGSVTLSATANDLSVGRYYVKSSSDNNLAVAPASYSYSVGSATASQSYIQEGNNVTVSYPSMTTDDPNPIVATPTLTGITFNGNSIACTATSDNMGFTFTVPAVTANSSYTLSIPANIIGYSNGTGTYNAAQDIVLSTPAVLDGTYFFKVTNETAAKGKYLARGKTNGTHATIDAYGLPIIVATDGNNVTTLSPADTKKFFYHSDSWQSWAHGESVSDAAKFTLTLNDGKYRIHNNSLAEGRYFKYNDNAVNDETIEVYDDGNGNNNGPIIDWAVETLTQHATAMQAMKNAQASTAATNAFASGNYASLNGLTTVSALETELTANYIQGDFVAPTIVQSFSEKYQGEQVAGPEIVYSNTINITEPGFYKFSMQAFYRGASNEVTQAMHTAGADFPPVVLFFGDAQTQIKSIYDEPGMTQEECVSETYESWNPVTYNGKYYPNGPGNALKVFQLDMYHNDVWLYVSAADTYTYGVKYMGWAGANMQWFIYSPESVTITSYAAAATDEEYTAMENALTNASEKLGFEIGDIAPYVLTPLATQANSIVSDHNTNETKYSKLVVNSLTAQLNSRNTEVMDAIYDGGFENTAVGSVKSGVTGWTTIGESSGDNSVFRQIYSANKFASGKGLYVWPSTFKYGETSGYTMPLEANSIYKFTYSYAGQSDNVGGTPKISILNSSDGLAATETGYNAPKYDSGVKTYSIYFLTGEAGNYVFTYEAPQGTNTVFGDLSLKRVDALEFADGSVPNYAPGTYPSVKITRTLTANRWATAVYPFAVSGVDNIAVLDSYDANTGELGFTNASTSVANEPFLMRSTNGASEITMSNVDVVATAEAPAVTKSGVASLKGTYSSIDITNAEKNYVLSANTIYEVGTAGATINPYRAYIQMAEGAAEARSLTFVIDGEATAIKGIDTDKQMGNGNVYNLKGQKVSGQLKKGVYVLDGKKVAIK